MNRIATLMMIMYALTLAGCTPKEEPAPAAGGAATSPPAAKPEAASPPAQEAKPAAAGHGGEIVELGTATIGEWTVRASRDQGEIKPGGDAPIDVWVTTAEGTPATVSAVRFWIGLEDAKGSVKAKADIEDPAQPNHWHTHAEVPSPLPDGSRLWVEIESATGKTAGSFNLKP